MYILTYIIAVLRVTKRITIIVHSFTNVFMGSMYSFPQNKNYKSNQILHTSP